MRRGEIFLASVPHASASAPKSRPVFVVQDDYYNKRIQNVLVATITSNLARKDDPAHLLLEISKAEEKQSGLHKDSLVSCLNIAIISKRDLGKKIGELSDQAMIQVDACLKKAFGLK